VPGGIASTTFAAMSGRSAYGTLKRAYHALVPHAARDGLYNALPDPVRRARHRLLVRLQASAGHDEIYDDAYYRGLVDPVMDRSAAAIAASVIDAWRPATVFDVGCGTGRLLLEFRDRGVHGSGLELSEAAIALCRSRGLTVHRLDLEHDRPDPSWRADVVVCTEVAEHLPERCADGLVDALTGLADRVAMTAAQPGGMGDDHVNEQPHAYWVAKFADRGFAARDDLAAAWRRAWADAGVEGCFIEGLMVFERATATHGAAAPAGG
jgi:SAM-dependent methyltransferase